MAVIPLRVHRMKKKLEKMQLKERLIYGYGRVILRMIVSGVLSLIVIGLLMGNMLRYVENVERADVAVKICRIDVNSAARNIREMALNSDTSTYDSYQQQVETQLAEVDSELKALKATESYRTSSIRNMHPHFLIGEISAIPLWNRSGVDRQRKLRMLLLTNVRRHWTMQSLLGKS